MYVYYFSLFLIQREENGDLVGKFLFYYYYFIFDDVFYELFIFVFKNYSYP